MKSHRRSLSRALRAGFSVVEVCVAACVLAISLSGMVAALVTSLSLNRVNSETAAAQQAARARLEALQGVPFGEVFAVHNDSTADDGGLTVAARGSAFDVAGFTPAAGDADGRCGEVIFPAVRVGAALELREDVVDAALGMPRDLNGDGAIDALDHAADYVLLPVRIRVAWRGASGERQMDYETILCRR